MVPSLLNLFAVVLRPFRERLYGLPQGASERGQLVFDPWRDGGKDGSSDEAVALKADVTVEDDLVAVVAECLDRRGARGSVI